MQAVILAGGLGSRLGEETDVRPKPMVEIGGKPILWHIMKYYEFYGISDFIIACGYKGNLIKEYFMNLRTINSNFTINTNIGDITFHENNIDNWNVTLVDTGAETGTGGRLLKIRPYIRGEIFCMTYGDGLSDVNIANLLQKHLSSENLVTVTAVKQPFRFGSLNISGSKVTSFTEKLNAKEDYINGGFFVINQQALDMIESEDSMWELGPLQNLAKENKLGAYIHDGFWQPMDTLREKLILQKLWQENRAPWNIWK